MTPQQRAEHDALDQPIAKILGIAREPTASRRSSSFCLMRLLLLQRVISNGLGQLRFDEVWPTYAKARPDDALIEGLFSPKLFELRRLVLATLAVEQRRKVVIFSQWRRMLRLAAWSLGDVLGDAGLEAVFFTGAETAQARTRNVVALHDDPRVAVMLLSDAGGIGLNLQRAASACINLELPWNPAVLEQRVSRIYRNRAEAPDRRLPSRVRSRHRSAHRFARRDEAGFLLRALRRHERRDPIPRRMPRSFLRIERLVGVVPPVERAIEVERRRRRVRVRACSREPDVDADAVDPIADTRSMAPSTTSSRPRRPRIDRRHSRRTARPMVASIELPPGATASNRRRTAAFALKLHLETARALVGLLEGLAKLVAGVLRDRVDWVSATRARASAVERVAHEWDPLVERSADAAADDGHADPKEPPARRVPAVAGDSFGAASGMAGAGSGTRCGLRPARHHRRRPVLRLALVVVVHGFASCRNAPGAVCGERRVVHDDLARLPVCVVRLMLPLISTG